MNKYLILDMNNIKKKPVFKKTKLDNYFKNYYAVSNGRKIGIFDNWNDCNNSICKYENAKFKKFNSLNDAKLFLINNNISSDKIIIYNNNDNNDKLIINNDLLINNDNNDDLLINNDNEFKKIFMNKLNELEKDIIYVYTDGSCINNGKKNALAGLGVYFSENDSRNISKKVIGKQTNNTAELSAIIEAYYILENEIKEGKKIAICSDSKISIGWCTTTGRKYESQKWTKKDGKIPNLQLIQKAYYLFKNKPNIRFMKVKAHTGGNDRHSIGNDGADKLANKAIGLKKCPYEKIYLNISYENKDNAKKLGAKWDPKKKKWYTLSTNKNIKYLLEIYNIKQY